METHEISYDGELVATITVRHSTELFAYVDQIRRVVEGENYACQNEAVLGEITSKLIRFR